MQNDPISATANLLKRVAKLASSILTYDLKTQSASQSAIQANLLAAKTDRLEVIRALILLGSAVNRIIWIIA